MTRRIIHLAFFAILISTMFLAMGYPVESEAPQRGKSLVLDSSYRSRTATHKVIVQSSDSEMRNSIIAEGGSLIEDYGAFALFAAPSKAANLVASSPVGSVVRDDMNLILLRTGPIDTTEAQHVSVNSLSDSGTNEEQLYLVQMVGPIRRQWLEHLTSAAEVISYIPNNAYLVRATSGELEQINKLKAESHFVQWTGSFRPEYKIAPEIQLNSDDLITTTVQLATSSKTQREIQDLVATSDAAISAEPIEVLNYTNIRITVAASKLAEIAQMSNVVWIEPWSAPQLMDEKQDLIVAGRYDEAFKLAAPGYLAWLQSRGLASTPDFFVDISDSGIDQGILDPLVIHRDFRNEAGAARVVYARYLPESDGPVSTVDNVGHGTLNAAIVGGYNTETTGIFVDEQGYSLGLGVHPFVRLGITKIFDPTFTNPSYSEMVQKMYQDGARISSNSWGAYNNGYNADCQLYDQLVRDAQSNVSGNQEITIVFSSGNNGAGGQLSTPANAKNTIMVGASENLRPGFDGCRVDTDGADDITSIIPFSSGGPANDGRKRPDIVAPGTHIQGARSQAPGYTGSGVCGPPSYPFGQTLYTWSSGTSHSTPAVAGAAALVRQFFQQAVGKPPSPAMNKAFLTNSTTYLTGEGANDNLPGNNQGWGLVNIGRAFDGVPRLLVDQDQVLSEPGQVVTITGRVADPTKPFRVTLAWTDAPGVLAASPAVNNLNLEVTVGGKTYFGNNFVRDVSAETSNPDNVNNLEGVWAPAGTSGDFTIRIVAANIAGDGIPGNIDTTDQDFALVVYNVEGGVGGGGGGGGGGGEPIDGPPSVNLEFPAGGEHLLAGSFTRIQWQASDDNGITSQHVEFSADGQVFNLIASLDGNARSFDWRIPSIPTTSARVRVTVFDGVNLPVISFNFTPFEVVIGPPDITPPTVVLLSPNTQTTVGAGMIMPIKWTELDNVGVIQRTLELSTDNGSTFMPIASLAAPSSGQSQNYDWQIPIELQTDRAKVRVTVVDGSGNSASATSSGKFDIWPLPIITNVEYLEGNKHELRLKGRYFRMGETEIWVSGKKLKKIKVEDSGNETSKKVSSFDKKLKKRVPVKVTVNIEVRLPRTGQVSPAFEFKRKKNN